MRKKLILFDWGNIVESHSTGYSCADAFNDLFKACGYIGDDNIFASLSKYKLSSIPTVDDFEDTYNQIASDYNFKTTYVEFIRLYKKIFDKIDYYKDVAEYEKSLRDKCYIGILSNLTVFDKERLNKQVDLSQYDYVFLSFEMNCKKPSREIYEKVNEKIPFAPEDILFIDDKQSNIDAAKELCWNTLKATGLELEKIKEYCEKFIKGDDSHE
jgi:HAD superfamily hydrolase (TIGR01509 family)